ncbi:uncharacterized protein LOC105178045 [Sesamum indicum]|uniref:Uncharacterized protein LOC105178045 n=1 Tax=Sesamum indicum TaxID=4182 RepID=A0A6I9UKS4_SESIN|nr:uncharacterized protein LOC105178045 [Sesamum indicum]XP_020554716.1 uncharacterized protein LOC105178045 [Sesamum indicum]
MFPLKLVRSLVSGDNVTNNPLLLRIHHDDLDESDDNHCISTQSRARIPLMLFAPTQELVKDTYRLASIARVIGMDLRPNPSLSHIIFSWPSPPPPCPPSSSSSTSSSSWGSSFASSSSYSWSLPNDSVPLPFPSFTTASLSHLRLFASLSRGYFKLAFLKNNCGPLEKIESLSNNNWHCTSLSLFASRTGQMVDSMDGFSKALLGAGWSLFKSNSKAMDFKDDDLEREVYLYRKLDVSRICNTKQMRIGNGDSGECSRVRELKLPSLDFRNAPLRILQYILLMTDDVFYLA